MDRSLLGPYAGLDTMVVILSPADVRTLVVQPIAVHFTKPPTLRAGVNSDGPGSRPIAEFSEHGNTFLGSRKAGNFLTS
jgi:hypothetical protein